MNIDLVTDILNGVALIIFVALLGAAVVRMMLRIVFYRLAGYEASVILRRDFALLGALLLIFGGAVIVRGEGWVEFLSTGWPHFIYILANDLVGLSALGYWVWAEYFVIGRPGKGRD